MDLALTAARVTDASVPLIKQFTNLDDLLVGSTKIGWDPQTGRFVFVVGNYTADRVFSTNSFAAGQFYHVAGTFDGTTMKLYVNGQLEGQLITLAIYNAKSRTERFVPVFFEPKDEPFIPEPIRGHTHYLLESEANYDQLYAFLTGQAGVQPGSVATFRGRPL